MRILNLSISNFMRITGVELQFDPEGNLVILAGENGAGKTSVLDAIQAALVGPRAFPAVPVHVGAEQAEIVIDIGDAIITRRIKAGGTQSLTVRLKAGDLRGNQGWLDARIGAMSFDPLAFTRLVPKAQAEALRKLVGLDLTEVDAEAKRLYDERTDVNRKLHAAEAVLAAQPIPSGPFVEVPLSDLAAEVTAATELAGQRERIRQTGLALREQETLLTADIRRAEEQLTRLRAKRDAIAPELALLREQYETFVVPDVDTISARLVELESANRSAREAASARQARAKTEVQVMELRQQSQGLTAQVEALAAKRQAAIAAVDYPIAWLGIDDGVVTYHDLPLSMASQAEQIQVSTAIGLAANPELCVLCVRDASLLDAKSLAIVRGMAARAGAQVFLEMVTSTEPDAILIEDGRLADVPAEPAEVTT